MTFRFPTSRRFLPRSLLGRSLLIVLIPLVMVEVVAMQLFYGSHLDIVTRRLAGGIAGEIATTIDTLQRFPGPNDQAWALRSAADNLDLTITISPGDVLPPNQPQASGRVEGDLASALRERLQLSFTTDWQSDQNSVLVRVQLPSDVLNVTVPRKRLYGGTIYIFVLWLVGSAMLLFGIAALFMRNQVRSVRKLASAMESFGLGRDPGPLKPAGAAELRRTAHAFNLMQERVRRFMRQRTDMLAGVSHDLRTPLTRLRLTLAMLPGQDSHRQDFADIVEDVDEMDRMIGAYLAFTRGVGTEQSRPSDLSALLQDVAARARRAGAAVDVEVPDELTVPLRADAFRRAITNLIDNARRHARRAFISASRDGRGHVVVTVDDDGPGIPANMRDDVFRPFETGAHGGTGLGLTIARDIVHAHGGVISLGDAPAGGLRARIVLPV